MFFVMAQPKKPEHLKQDKNIPVRMTKDEHKRLMRQSKETGVAVSERALSCLLSQLERWEKQNLPTEDSPTT